MFFINGQPSDKVMTLDKFPDNTPKIEIDIIRMQILYNLREMISINGNTNPWKNYSLCRYW